MRVGLFIPCYIDQFYPQVGMATVEVLERHGVEIDFPAAQTCCGQPMANTGCIDEARPLAERFVADFRKVRIRRVPVRKLRRRWSATITTSSSTTTPEFERLGHASSNCANS